MNHPTLFVDFVLIGWIPLVSVLFMFLSPRRAVISAFIIGWLFLPPGVGYSFPGLPSYNKLTALSFGVVMLALLFDHHRMLAFRPRWFDVPMAIFCLSPFASSLSNGLGAYDGISAVVKGLCFWGLPYTIGRIYINDLESLRELAIGIMVGGLVYVPMCLYEVRMSPQLCNLVYGYRLADFRQVERWGDTGRPYSYPTRDWPWACTWRRRR